MIEPTQEDVQRVCAKEWPLIKANCNEDWVSITILFKALTQSRLQNEKLEGQLIALRSILDGCFGAKPPLGTNFYAFCTSLEAKAKEVWIDTHQAAQQAEARIYNQAIRDAMNQKNFNHGDQFVGNLLQNIEQLIKPEVDD